MKTTKSHFKYLKHFFVSILLVNLTLTIGACSDDTLEEQEELMQFSSDKDEEPDPDDRVSLLASDKDEEPDPDNRD